MKFKLKSSKEKLVLVLHVSLKLHAVHALEEKLAKTSFKDGFDQIFAKES